MATYYAWSPIRGAVHSNSGDRVDVRVGDKVTQSDLGIDDDEWQYLVDTGAVRTKEYPVDPNSALSPVEHIKQQAAQMMEGGFSGGGDEEAIAEKLDTNSEPTNRFA